GLRPEDIHLVMCTHLHFDHVGWNTRLQNGRWVPTFPNARYLFGKRDIEFFSAQRHEATHREAFEDSVAPILDAGRADIVDVGARVHREIGDGVWLEDASGHSPGNLCVIAECGAERAVFSGEDPSKASATRHRLLDQYADSGAVFFPAHFTGTSAGCIERQRQGGLRYRFLQS